MIVGSVELCLRLDGCFSLKDKRRVIKGLIERVRRDFQVSAAEVADHDLWNSAVIGVACVSSDAQHAESVLQHVIDAFDRSPEVSVESADKLIEHR